MLNFRKMNTMINRGIDQKLRSRNVYVRRGKIETWVVRNSRKDFSDIQRGQRHLLTVASGSRRWYPQEFVLQFCRQEVQLCSKELLNTYWSIHPVFLQHTSACPDVCPLFFRLVGDLRWVADEAAVLLCNRHPTLCISFMIISPCVTLKKRHVLIEERKRRVFEGRPVQFAARECWSRTKTDTESLLVLWVIDVKR